MKILHFIYDHIKNPWVGGGGAVRVYEIYKRLSGKEHRITVISGNFPKAEDYKVNENFEYRFVGSDKNYILSTFSYAFKAYKFLKESFKDYDVIIEDFAPWNPIFAYKLQDIKPLILQIHHKTGTNILKKYNIFGLPFLFIENYYPKRFKNIISVSFQTLEKFNVRGTVIPNGIPFTLDEKDLNIGNYILYVGRIDFFNKGLDLLINADIEYPVVIAGKGKDEDKLKNLKSNYKYIGFVDKKTKLDLIKNAKFLIMPSRFEGQGIVALESASMGKPVIASDIQELRYVVENRFGISFKNEDIEDFKEKINYLWNNEDLILKMGKKGIEYAKKFTWDKIASEFEDYLLRVLSYHA
jgi:glycogen(starch) synthase